MDSIPAPGALAPVDKVQLAQVAAFPNIQSLHTQIGTPYFRNLYPFAVHQQLSAYNDRRKNVTNGIVEKLTSANQEAVKYGDTFKSTIIICLCRCVAALGLPGSIQAFEQPMGLPGDLLKKSEQVKAEGGSQLLVENMQTLKVLAQEASDLLTQVSRYTRRRIVTHTL